MELDIEKAVRDRYIYFRDRYFHFRDDEIIDGIKFVSSMLSDIIFTF
jgi:hypothetical protein